MMKRFTARTAIICFVAMALGMWGCAQTPEEPQAAAPEPTGSEFSASEPEAPPPAPAPAPKLELFTVYFDYDRSEIREDARPVLRSDAEALRGGSQKVTIEGHCDERGDEEYNLALGERRANVVKKYMVNLGIEASRLRTLSYGEAKAAAKGHDESAWRWNRRAEFRVHR